MDVTVAVATFGGAQWETLARDRAIPSAEALDVPVVHVHADTLHDARNGALDQVRSEWVCHLDADDELEAGFFDAIATGTADVRAPAVRYIRTHTAQPPRVPRVAGHDHDCVASCLAFGNWLVVGAVVRADLVRQVGGWRDFSWSEDWDLWARCWLAGATIEAIPQAIYRAHVTARSRNRAPSRRTRHEVHQAIARANGLPVPA